MSVEQAANAETALVAPASKRGETRMFGPIAVGLALLSAFITFIVLADFTPILPTHNVVVTLLLANAATVLLLLGVIVREVWQMVQARRTGRAAARLHVRIVGLFSIIAAAPAILVAIVASVTLDRGLDRLFSTPHARGNREFADRGGSLSARSRADRALRHHGHGHRDRACQAGCSSKTRKSCGNI